MWAQPKKSFDLSAIKLLGPRKEKNYFIVWHISHYKVIEIAFWSFHDNHHVGPMIHSFEVLQLLQTVPPPLDPPPHSSHPFPPQWVHLSDITKTGDWPKIMMPKYVIWVKNWLCLASVENHEKKFAVLTSKPDSNLANPKTWTEPIPPWRDKCHR